MCFHVKQSKKAQEVEHRFKVKVEKNASFQQSNHFNGFDFPKMSIISNQNPEVVNYYHWGLVPHWAKDTSIKQYTLNAKIETLDEKPSFRDCINNRCLVIADGFYEWQWLDRKGKNKQKYEIGLPDDSLFAFAGIWSKWIEPETQNIFHTMSIVTTQANKLMSTIHNIKKRMPVILTSKNETDWLEGADIEQFIYPDIELKATKITPLTLF